MCLDLSHFSPRTFFGFRPEIWQLTHLKRLTLEGNALAVLPPDIGQLTSLRRLYLGSNDLTVLPPEIGQLRSLQQLDLAENHLTELPPEIGRLTYLQRLNLRGNHLTVLPPEIGQLTRLQHLDLHGNRLTALPPELKNLTRLRRLNLYYNPLSSLPREIEHLPSLCQLSHESGSRLMALDFDERKRNMGGMVHLGDPERETDGTYEGWLAHLMRWGLLNERVFKQQCALIASMQRTLQPTKAEVTARDLHGRAFFGVTLCDEVRKMYVGLAYPGAILEKALLEEARQKLEALSWVTMEHWYVERRSGVPANTPRTLPLAVLWDCRLVISFRKEELSF